MAISLGGINRGKKDLQRRRKSRRRVQGAESMMSIVRGIVKSVIAIVLIVEQYGHINTRILSCRDGARIVDLPASILNSGVKRAHGFLSDTRGNDPATYGMKHFVARHANCL